MTRPTVATSPLLVIRTVAAPLVDCAAALPGVPEGAVFPVAVPDALEDAAEELVVTADDTGTAMYC